MIHSKHIKKSNICMRICAKYRIRWTFLRGSINLPSDQLHSLNNTPYGSFARYETWKIPWDRFHLNSMLSSDINTAIISLIHKKGKYHSLCTSLRSISLLNSEIKLHAEVTAGRLEKVPPRLVHYNQTGFMNHGPFIRYSADVEKTLWWARMPLFVVHFAGNRFWWVSYGQLEFQSSVAHIKDTRLKGTTLFRRVAKNYYTI